MSLSEAFTRFRRLADGSLEWSVLLDGTEPGKPTRLHVVVDEPLIAIDECRVTSASEQAERLRGGTLGRLSLTPDEARWLRDTLDEAIDVAAEESEARDTIPVPSTVRSHELPFPSSSCTERF